MASQSCSSRFFSLRPQLQGVGRADLSLSSTIFSEFIKLSPLAQRIADMGISYENSMKDDSYLDDIPDIEVDHLQSPTNAMNDQLESSTFNKTSGQTTEIPLSEDAEEENTSFGQRDTDDLMISTPSKPSKDVSKYPTHIIDRDPSGSEKLVPYTFNKNTLKVFDIFKSLNIPFVTELYKPKEERMCVSGDVFYCKNLFLKDRKGQYFLVICHEDTNMNLKYLRVALKAYRNFNFVTRDEMNVLLGTDPGGVTPLALMFANALDVSMVISKTLHMDGAQLMFHPLDGALATKISLPSLLRFLKYVGHTVEIVD